MSAPITGDTLSLSRIESLFARIHIPLTPDGRIDFDACWPWIGLVAPNGYGCIVWRDSSGRNIRLTPHRLVNEHAARAPIPAGVQVDHLCNCRLCCNPTHHERVSRSVNLARRALPRPDWRAARDRALALAHLQESYRHG